jgi:hypothetical protein
MNRPDESLRYQDVISLAEYDGSEPLQQRLSEVRANSDG